MTIQTVTRPEQRLIPQYLSQLNIQSYGEDNLYPQRMLDLIENSPTGGTCCDRFQTFIEGDGFNNIDFADYICNRHGETNDDIFRLVARDIANHNGFALHVNYNLAGQITELNHVPFMDCRLEEPDDRGYVAFISIHPDWRGEKSRSGKSYQVKKDTVRKVYVFNPRREVVLSQMIADGGIDLYRGQILWVSLEGKMEYPKPIYDKIVSNLSTDAGLDNVKYRNVRNNFLLSGMLIHKRGTVLSIDDEGNEIITNDEDDDFTSNLDTFQGDTNACTIMDITVNNDEDIPKFVSVEGVNFDKKFQTTEQSVTERIYSAFGQEPWYCIRVGKTGFSGDVLKEAYEYYNSYVDKYRRAASRAFKKIYTHWFEDIKTDDFTIHPLIYQYNYSNGSLEGAEQLAQIGTETPQRRR